MNSRSQKPQPAPDVRFAAVHVVDHGRRQSRLIRLAYRDTGPDSKEVPVLLVHGSPGSGDVLRRLADLLSPHSRVIVPDLPGFGASEHNLPDYSFRAHGAYLLELLDALHVARAHLVGFSMGGGVVLSIVDLGPQRSASLVLLSAIGVQEHELSGSYSVNQALHGTQLAALRFLRDWFPHFGLFSRLAFSVEYARNFFDSDQRPLRAALESYRGPTLIIHGDRDHNVPIAAAWEHYRLVPQSELVELDGNHLIAFMNPSAFADRLVGFLNGTR